MNKSNPEEKRMSFGRLLLEPYVKEGVIGSAAIAGTVAAGAGLLSVAGLATFSWPVVATAGAVGWLTTGTTISFARHRWLEGHIAGRESCEQKRAEMPMEHSVEMPVRSQQQETGLEVRHDHAQKVTESRQVSAYSEFRQI